MQGSKRSSKSHVVNQWQNEDEIRKFWLNKPWSSKNFPRYRQPHGMCFHSGAEWKCVFHFREECGWKNQLDLGIDELFYPRSFYNFTMKINKYIVWIEYHCSFIVSFLVKGQTREKSFPLCPYTQSWGLRRFSVIKALRQILLSHKYLQSTVFYEYSSEFL